MPLKLIVANKAYSSWSQRAWILLAHFKIPFEETVIPLDLPETRRLILKHSPSAKCPALIDGPIIVWESLAIMEYVAEIFPEKAILPRGKAARAHARSLAAEMHQHRRGPQALLELTTWAERGYDLTITPDGPRGPCYQVQEGVMSLAQVTGFPVVPVAFNLNWKLRVKSWDRFQIPLPFARCEVTVGRVMRVPGEATDAERESLRQQLESELRAISQI